MFFCDKCAKKRQWPTSSYKSNGRCEICRKSRPCSDVPSYALPISDLPSIAPQAK